MATADLVFLGSGVLAAGVGGELFVRGAVGLAHWARLSPGIVGATVAAFATSSPELSVATMAALEGKPQIALGDALGSNVVNVALILGFTVAISGQRMPAESARRDLPVALAGPLLTGLLLLDGSLSRLDGALLLVVFLLWMTGVVLEVRRQRRVAEVLRGERRSWPAVLFCVVGLGLLLVAGRLVVLGARGLAQSFGIDAFLVGATLVAIGTSMPELATSLVATWRGHDEVGLGTILGSNIFNGLWVVGVAATITPIAVPVQEVQLVLGFGLAALFLLILPNGSVVLQRWRGWLLLILYGVYVLAIVRGRGLIG
ncbi:calcium/sodium antiporter [Cyanobium gracile]|uniref:K+dependent Na+ exchanger related-protein n=1 Tax=Cyanobium gracile (strain ATCC 27147 / PCC 6307) TaxID=292564 RepID=K9P8E4_CYAGP|nr:calcium/sodium antiporter [Cyanobium gracile]AFY29687.1 K+dependent Na+ exchanger related-protein [Cyanobium gracile PCC 6307]